MFYKGKVIFDGFSSGEAFVIKKQVVRQAHKFTSINQEFQRFDAARKAAVDTFNESYNTALKTLGEKEAILFETHRLMAEDLDFEDAVREGINNYLIAEEAVKQAGEQLAAMFKAMDDEYMKERAADVLEVSHIIYNLIAGLSNSITLDHPAIIVCEDLEASKLMKVDKKNILGIVFTKCGTNSHVAIFIRTLEIPSLCMVKDLDLALVENGDKIFIDTAGGKVYVNPSEEESSSLVKKREQYLAEKAELEKFRGKETISKDGKKFKIYANIAGSKETPFVIENDAEGVGLFRSEFLYLNGTTYPTEDQQFEEYKKVALGMKGKEVIIRTFDIGADKKADYFNLPDEENPALGYRSIRICRDRPEMFLTQITALYRASAFGNISIMVPMIISLEEIDFIHEICKQARDNLTKRGEKFNPQTKVGIMIETPAAALISDKLAKEVDFFSIGTNDLSQYTLACDRLNTDLNRTFDPYHKAILRLIKLTVDNAHKAGIPVGMCGELARDEKVAPFLLKIGLDEFSLSSAFVLKLRKLISETDISSVNIDSYIG